MEPSKLRRLKMNFFLCTTGAMLTGIIADLVYHLFSTEWSQREMMLVLGFLFSRVMQLSDEILDLLVCQILSIDGYIYIYTSFCKTGAAKQGMRAAFFFLLSKTLWELCGQENPAQSQQTSRSQTCVCTCNPACTARPSTVPTHTLWACTSIS